MNSRLGTRVRLAGASLLAIFGVITIAVLVFRGGAPDVTSPEIVRQIYGCYYLDGRLVLKLSSDGMAHISGSTIRFSVVSLKSDLNIRAEGRLVVTSGPGGVRRVQVTDGLPLYLPVRLGPNPMINITALNGSGNSDLEKGPCRDDGSNLVH
jgi:hypothetical protein